MKDSLVRHYQKEQRKALKKLVLSVKIFLKKRKTKSDNMVANDIQIFVEMKNIGYLSIEKNIIKYGKTKPLHK